MNKIKETEKSIIIINSLKVMISYINLNFTFNKLIIIRQINIREYEKLINETIANN
jgi:hypothetical protein